MRRPSGTFPLILCAGILALASATLAQRQSGAVEGTVGRLGAPEISGPGLPPDVPQPPSVIGALPTLPDHGLPPVPVGRNDLPQPESPPSLPAIGSPPGAPCSFVQHTDTQVTPAGQNRSRVGEPSVAVRGTTGATTVFMTGNWYAARSTDSGATFTYINPYTTFPSVDGGFCCDQRVLYEPSRDITIWYLQYLYSAATAKGSVRIAVAVGADLNLGAAGTWQSWVFSPQDFDCPSGEWLDFPDMACNDGYLYCASNVFDANDVYKNSVVWRMDLDDLRDGGTLDYVAWRRDDLGGSSYRFAQNSAATQYFAAHLTTATMRVYRNTPPSNLMLWDDRSIPAWSPGPYVARAPNGVNWLGRADSRITGGYANCDEYGFGWTSAAIGSQTRPHVRVARFRTSDNSFIGVDLIWNNSYGIAYSAFATNLIGQPAIAVAFGAASASGTLHPTTLGRIRDDCDPSFAGGFFNLGVAGTASPTAEVWGDYYSLQRHPVRPMKFCSTAMSMQGGGDNTNQIPHFSYFGRQRDDVAWVSVGIKSVPINGIAIDCTPDKLGKTSVTTHGYASYDPNISYTLTAPAGANVGGTNYAFCNWRFSGVPAGGFNDRPAGELVLVVAGNGTRDDRAEAVYTEARRVDVGSRNPGSGITITVSRADIFGAQDGATTFTRWYKPGSGNASFTAPAADGVHPFNRWYLNGVAQAPGLNPLVVDIGVGTVPIVVEAEYCTHTDGAFTPYGAGCLGANGVPDHFGIGQPDRGTAISYQVRRAASSTPSALFLGFSKTSWNGTPLPLCLGFLGADPSCCILGEVFVVLPFTTNSVGAASKNVQSRVSMPIGTLIYTQTVHIDFSVPSPLAITMSNGLETMLGGDQCN